MRPSLESTEAEIISFARAWVELVARDGLASALRELDTREGYVWTAEDFEYMSRDHFGDGQGCKITTAEGIKWIRVAAYRYNDGSGFGVDHDLALNGKLSDFTLQLDFRKGKDGYLVYLDDIHIL